MSTKESYADHEAGYREHRHHHHHGGGGSLLEAAIMAPFAIAGCVLQVVKQCVTSLGCGTWCNSCETCGCNCRCEEKEEHHSDCCTADIKIDTRIGEVREKVILVENNSQRTTTITLEADPWLNAAGTQGGASIVFNPPTVTLDHCQTAFVTATITVNQPLEAGKSYFSRIYLKGCSRKPITVELCVASDTRVDFYADCESCRPSCGQFVEFCHEPAHKERCKPKSHRAPFWFNLFDPHCHWFDACSCERFLLPNLFGSRCC